jgi:hypothetical protein
MSEEFCESEFSGEPMADKIWQGWKQPQVSAFDSPYDRRVGEMVGPPQPADPPVGIMADTPGEARDTQWIYYEMYPTTEQ